MSFFLVPGDLIALASCPDWGLGQVQSVDGLRLTANFEHAGKRVLLLDRVRVEKVFRETAATDPTQR